MVVYSSLDEVIHLAASVVTMGTFDGVHVGHQTIFKQVIEKAVQAGIPSVAITYSPHPQHVVKRADEPEKRLVNCLDEKIRKISDAGIDYLLIVPFTGEFSRITADAFLQHVVIDLFHPREIIIGYDHHFGLNREGTPAFLQERAADNQYTLNVIQPVREGDRIISSSRIRQLIESGDIATAGELLGEPYRIRGVVASGLGRGKTLGYPTANLRPECSHQILPPDGVYCVQCDLYGDIYDGICNIGMRPTFADATDRTIEVHVFDLEPKSLYGASIVIRFRCYVRPERRFEDTTELIEQIRKDILVCKKLREDNHK